MNAFLYRALTIIKSQTGANFSECKLAFDRTRSIPEAIRQLHLGNTVTKMEQNKTISHSHKIIFCRGIQGSGKTTWAKDWVVEDPEHRIRINWDDLRNMFGKYWVPSRENLIKSTTTKIMEDALKAGYDIVVDNMNLSESSKELFLHAVNTYNEWHTTDRYKIEYKDFKTDVEECIKRDSKRPNPIGEKIIRETYNRNKMFYETSNH